MNENERVSGRSVNDVSDSAAAMLLRLGFAIFAVVIPSATLLSRWLIVILVPIGAVLIILSALMKDDPARIWRNALDAICTEAGIIAVLFGVWAVASLAWTPFPQPASEKLFKALGILGLGLLAISALPARMRATNLYLVTIGVAIGAALILVGSLAESSGIGGIALPAATPSRVSVLLTVLGWLGAAWMLIKGRPKLAVALMVLVSLAVALGPAREAVLPLVAAVLVVGAAWNHPHRVGRILAAVLALLVLATPLFALAGAFLPPGGIASALEPWMQLIREQPLRFVTGHGFDAASAARIGGIIPAGAHVSLVADVWFDLGLLGAIGFAGIVHGAYRAAGDLGLELAPAALGALTAGFIYAVIERGATQTWWLNGMTVAGIVLVSLVRGRYRTVRPRARFKPGAAVNAPAADDGVPAA